MQATLTVVGKILASTRRLRILATIQEGAATPKLISTRLDIPLSHVSKTLRELEKFGVVECKTPDLRKGRIFSITPSGNQIMQTVRSIRESRGGR